MPGAVDGWLEAHGRFGRLPLAECLRPAIEYARDGFPVGASLARFSLASLDLLRAFPTTAATYLKADGSPYRHGRDPAHARAWPTRSRPSPRAVAPPSTRAPSRTRSARSSRATAAC